MKTKTAAFIAALLITASAAAQSAYATAATIPESDATIEFTTKETTPPVDPEEPEVPQPTPPEVPPTGQTGDVTIDVVPHPYFGVRPVSTLNANYYSRIVLNQGSTPSASAQTFIQVSDARPRPVSTVWSVSAQAEEFVNDSDSVNVILGAKLTFEQGTVRGPVGIVPPVSIKGTLNCAAEESGGAPVKLFEVDPDESADSASGTWVSCLYPSPWTGTLNEGDDNPFVHLFIPANSGVRAGASYTCEITWTLQQTP